MPPWVAKEKIETLLLASEMPVSIPRSRTVRPPVPLAFDFADFGVSFSANTAALQKEDPEG